MSESKLHPSSPNVEENPAPSPRMLSQLSASELGDLARECRAQPVDLPVTPAPDSEESEIVQNIRLTAPKRIFLNVGPDESLDAPGDFKDLDLAEVTWCEDGQENCDVEYVRADLVASHASLLEAVTAVQKVAAEWVDADQNLTAFRAMNKILAILEAPALVGGGDRG